MKRVFFQYVGMGGSLLSMFWAIAYLRRAAESTYLAQMAVFLILLAWSTPFETSFGNVLIGAARTNQAAVHHLIGGAFNRSMYWKAVITAAGFAIAFFLYSQKNPAASMLTAAGIGILFFLRLVEYVLKIKLLFANWGQEAQITCNLITAAKWLAAAGFVMAGMPSFGFFVLSHVALGVASITILSISFLSRRSSKIREEVRAPLSAQLKNDLVAILGMGAGVLAYQIDKLVAAYFYSTERFGEYVSVYTLAFVGPYVINPIFVLALQKLSPVTEKKGATYDDVEHLVYAMMRVAALIINVLIPVAVFVLLNFLSKPLSAASQADIAVFVLASYLNCLCHIYYLMYLIRGDFRSILLQNITAIIFGAGGVRLLYVSHSHFLALVLLATATGQFVFGAARQISNGSRPKYEIVLPGTLIAVYLMAYALAYPMTHYYGAFAIAAIAIVLISLRLEMKALGLNWSDLPPVAANLTA